MSEASSTTNSFRPFQVAKKVVLRNWPSKVLFSELHPLHSGKTL